MRVFSQSLFVYIAGEEEEKASVRMWQKMRRVCMWRKYAAFTKQISSAQKILHNSSMCTASFLDCGNLFCS